MLEWQYKHKPQHKHKPKCKPVLLYVLYSEGIILVWHLFIELQDIYR